MNDRRQRIAEIVGLEVAIPGAIFLVTGAWLIVAIAIVIGGLSLWVSK